MLRRALWWDTCLTFQRPLVAWLGLGLELSTILFNRKHIYASLIPTQHKHLYETKCVSNFFLLLFTGYWRSFANRAGQVCIWNWEWIARWVNLCVQHWRISNSKFVSRQFRHLLNVIVVVMQFIIFLINKSEPFWVEKDTKHTIYSLSTLLGLWTHRSFIPSAALMHHSNHVDSSRCYQCVKFLVTLAQK